jgi:ATP-dependent Clp protease ATP-binding subunit ClpC
MTPCAWPRNSPRYLNDRFLPDKAIDVIDESGSRARIGTMTRPPEFRELEQAVETARRNKEEAIKRQEFEQAAAFRDAERREKETLDGRVEAWRKSRDERVVEVGVDDILSVVAKWTGIPLVRMGEQDMARLLRMEEELARTVVGQDEALHAIAKTLRRSRVDLKDPRRPIGSFAFLGPTGVGKTLLAKALAEFMFNDPAALIQIDMSEYMEKFSASRMVGAPPGYVGYQEGGQLTERVRRRPYSIILFDEIEKAHPDVMHMLLQILEEGHLTDGLGRKVDFKNTIIILTSNLGAELLRKGAGLGFGRTDAKADYESIKARMIEEAKRVFKPELLNRLDDLIVFRPLGREEIERIFDLEVAKFTKRLAARKMTLRIDPPAREFLLSKGFDNEYGARPMRRAVEKHLEDPLAEKILGGHAVNAEAVEVLLENGALVFHLVAPSAAAP